MDSHNTLGTARMLITTSPGHENGGRKSALSAVWEVIENVLHAGAGGEARTTSFTSLGALSLVSLGVLGVKHHACTCCFSPDDLVNE